VLGDEHHLMNQVQHDVMQVIATVVLPTPPFWFAIA
jgi:hypothetical protein